MNNNIEQFRFSDPRQERIYRRLLLIGQGPASFYQDACFLMQKKIELKSITHIVSHLLREIESSLRDVLEPIVELSDLENLGAKYGRHKAEIIIILKALKISETEKLAKVWLKLAGKENEYGLNARAHRDNLSIPRPLSHEFFEFWDEFQTILDLVLEKFESHFIEYFNKLDRLLEISHVRESEIKLLKQKIPNNKITFNYFFDKLSSHEWLIPLNSNGFFDNPPPIIKDGIKGRTAYPFWPESRYLARMASSAPQIVHDIILQVPETDNIRVHEDFIEAACSMPPELAANIAKKEIKWIKNQSSLFLLSPDEFAGLISHLALGGQIDTAIEFANTLLEILPDPNYAYASEQIENISEFYKPKPKTRIEDWEYEEILKKHIPVLIDTSGLKTLSLLIDLLHDYIRYSNKNKEENPDDLSFIWRPAIEDETMNYPYGLDDLLISSVRDSADKLIKTEGKAVLQLIESKIFKIFKRIGLYLRRKNFDVDAEGTYKLITDIDIIDDAHLQHEFYLLMNEQFNNLPGEVQKKYLEIVRKGTDLEVWYKFIERESGKRPIEEEGKRHIRRWQYEKLYPIQMYLVDEWQNIFNRRKEEFGELDHPDVPFHIGKTWHGPTSPLDSNEIKSMSTEEIVLFLKEWKPTTEPQTPSPEGLGRTISAIVASEPERFADAALKFKQLDPTYVRGLISGLREAASQHKRFNWVPVLELCDWVVKQPREIPGRKSEYSDLDPGWIWTRKSIADLLSVGFKDDIAEIPFELRECAWKILLPLTNDPDPTPEHEQKYGGSNMDPANLAINTTRGEAIHSVIRYALWVRRYIEKTEDGKNLIKNGFEELPEVREVLNYHLEPQNDLSLAIRSVYGQWFPWLVLIDSKWAAQNVIKIFPNDPSLTDLRDAAWDTYIAFCSAYDQVYEILSNEYLKAVERIGKHSEEKRYFANPDERLAEHLMVLYWRGKLDLNDQTGLLMKFYQKADDKLKYHAIQFIGTTLEQESNSIDPLILQRFISFWEYRLQAAKKYDPTLAKDELSAFGWWFISGKFDDDWAINQLKEALNLAGKIDPDYRVLERLAQVSVSFPDLSIDCLRLITENDREGMRLFSLDTRENARKILKNGISNKEEKIKESAIDLVHRLGAKGYLEFRDLL